MMRLTAEQFTGHPPTSPAKLYAIHGAEPLAALEAADTLRDVARRAGYTEREVFTVVTGFDWGQLRSAANAPSLFATQRLLELRIPTGSRIGSGVGDLLIAVTMHFLAHGTIPGQPCAERTDRARAARSTERFREHRIG